MKKKFSLDVQVNFAIGYPKGISIDWRSSVLENRPPRLLENWFIVILPQQNQNIKIRPPSHLLLFWSQNCNIVKLGYNDHSYNDHGYNDHSYNDHGFNDHGYSQVIANIFRESPRVRYNWVFYITKYFKLLYSKYVSSDILRTKTLTNGKSL